MSLAVSVFAADPYPSRTVRLVVPFAAGSATDTMARLLAQELSPRLGQSVVVENKAGGLGQIAAQHVARSAPDGYTLFVTTNTTHSANPHLFRTLPYDPIKDFEPIARTATLPFMLVVNGQLPVRSTAGFLSYAKANPGKLTYASASSTSLVAAESLNVLGHVSMVGVYYKASPQAILDVASGQVQVMVADFATAMPHVTAGRLKVLAVTTAKRSSLVPDAPPLGESVKGFDVTSWNGLFAPAGTPPEIVQRLARETLAVLGRPDVKSRLAAIGFEVDPLGPQDFAAYVRNQLDYWGRLVRDAGIRPE
ncbi:MAG: tripartite tricarboxylate transporter substrate binding protein [Betaproteobacteria bacterium]|nr:tripartite tricarboxylate transporter substrate binding protein [Betaproteobacteria bacterium]